MTPGGLVERRDAHQPVHAGFRCQQAIRIFAFDFERHAFDAGLFTRLIVDNLSLKFTALGPLQIHAQKHFSPVLRFRSTRAGMNRADSVAWIVLAGQQRLSLCLQDFVFESLE